MSYSKNVQPCECNIVLGIPSSMVLLQQTRSSTTVFLVRHVIQYALFSTTWFEWSGCFRVHWHFMPVILHACSISFSCEEVAKALNRERTLCLLPDDVLSVFNIYLLCSVNPCRPINSSLKSLHAAMKFQLKVFHLFVKELKYSVTLRSSRIFPRL